jgi:AcrR family transcriptional regulator
MAFFVESNHPVLNRTKAAYHLTVMGRHKQFKRDEVLEKALSVFWEKGISATTVQDLERVTGVNKSGLYSEFTDKEDIFLESLNYYLTRRGGEVVLTAEPRGWKNIQKFLDIGLTCFVGRRGCFSVNSMRDVGLLPASARQMLAAKNAGLRRLIIENIQAETPTANSGPLADVILTFYSGLCVEQNLNPSIASSRRRIKDLMNFLRQTA